MNPNPALVFSRKQDLLELLIKNRFTFLTAAEARQITFTLKGESIRIDGPRELLEKIARRMKRSGIRERQNPYGP